MNYFDDIVDVLLISSIVLWKVPS